MKRLLWMTLLAISAQAQKNYVLKGTVKDETTKEILIGANILFNQGEKPAISDADGNFSAKLKAGQNTILVRYVGYENFNQKIQLKEGENRIDILLTKKDSQLEEVVIKTGQSLQSVDRPILGANAMAMKTINKLPMPLGEIDVLKGLQMLPGVNSVGEASNGLNVRGGTTDQNLILLDNAPIFNPSHMFGLFSAFPSDGVSNILLFKGNIPAKYGGRTASVLDVQLSNPNLKKFKLDGGISFVSTKIKADIPLIKDKLGVVVSARGSFNDFLLPIISQDLKDIKSNFGDIATKVFYRMNQKNTLSFSHYLGYDYFQTDLLGTYSNITATATQYKYKTNNFSGKWTSVLSPNTSLETIVVSSIYNPEMLFPEVDSKNKVVISQGIDFKQIKTNVKKVSAKNSFETGLDLVKYSINPGQLIPGTSTSVTAIQTAMEQGLESGIYISDEFDPTPKLSLSGGLRYSYFFNMGPNDVRVYNAALPRKESTVTETLSYAKGEVSQKYGGLEPRFGLKYSLTKQTNFKVGYTFSRQYLEQISNTTTPLPTSRWKLADQNIKPQTSELFTGGFTQNTPNNMYQFGLEGYYRTTNNILDYKPGADFLLKNNPETEILQGLNKSYGVEFMVSKEKGFATGWVNYTYARSLNQVNEGPESEQQINFGNFYRANYDRPHTLNASLVVGQGKHHDFSFNFTYSTGRPFTTPQGYVEYNNTLFPYFSERNNERIPAYHRLDFAWNIYNPKMDPNRRFKGNWVFSVYNLYGRKNPYSVFYKSEGNVLNSYQLVIFGSPIPTLAYKCTFE